MMDTKTFFSMLFVLLLIGTMASMMSDPVQTIPQFNATTLTINSVDNSTQTCYYQYTGCEYEGCPQICYPNEDADAWFGIPSFIGWAVTSLRNGADFAIQCLAFFTGIGAIISGGLALPSPLDLILLLGVTFMWVFLALEVLSRVVGVIWGR